MGSMARLTGSAQPEDDGSSQQRLFRDSLRDAFDGVDVVELQTGMPAAGRPVLPPRRATADIVPLPTAAPPPLPPLPPAPPARDAALAQAMAPVLDELHALRAEVQRLREPADAHPALVHHGASSRDLVALAGMVLLGLAAVLFLAALLLRG